MPKLYSVIIASGSYIPTQKITNDHFLQHTFFEADGKPLTKDNVEIIRKFSEITGIQERRYVADNLVASDIGALAAKEALVSGKVDGESLDYIIVAHNFGDVKSDNRKSDLVPSLASRIKMQLGIINPNTVSYDLPFGCAGWLQGVIQADFFIKSGMAKRILVIGAETLSRICDPHDRDSMIYSDGAGAVILEATLSEKPVGILAHKTVTNAGDNTFVLKMQPSYNPDYPRDELFLKMKGRTLYEHALKEVPSVIIDSLNQAGVHLNEVNKLFIHQANNKMDEAILKRVFKECGYSEIPEGIMPMTISWLGNSSVATVPTLYDLVSKGKIENQSLVPGSIVIFAAVGAGVNINSVVYRIPDAE
ncbi:MAG: ketoacyl-ACP synthase III [Cyclobacteriaceae bacterium]|jgi:3-oxoacyl-[acyl-carrier-protein] synthase-3|nr:ketoacyl-ACP synthase III [Cyclobacteriaceae bacterium]